MAPQSNSMLAFVFCILTCTSVHSPACDQTPATNTPPGEEAIERRGELVMSYPNPRQNRFCMFLCVYLFQQFIIRSRNNFETYSIQFYSRRSICNQNKMKASENFLCGASQLSVPVLSRRVSHLFWLSTFGAAGAGPHHPPQKISTQKHRNHNFLVLSNIFITRSEEFITGYYY
jgi:hypothetical protein